MAKRPPKPVSLMQASRVIMKSMAAEERILKNLAAKRADAGEEPPITDSPST